MLSGISIGLATLAVLLIVAGLVLASDRKRHVPLMLTAFACDVVALVLVEVVIPIAEDKDDPLTMMTRVGEEGWVLTAVHGLFATLSIVGYVLQIVSGRKILKGDYSLVARHKKTARFFILMRALAYVTMFFA